MSKGFSGIPGGMQGLMKQAQKMQADLARAQEEAAEITAEGSAGGVVKVVANGKNQLVSVTLAKEALNPEDADVLQEAFLAAANTALNEAQETVRQKLAKITGGMNLPGLF
ncbi:MAG: YbaB/EbfC family nucleoid-associated protein [Oligoflexia bacterium]|nr:YbaB/EbfC family nucleoid-associated protein [Oligoflexia bacterium]